MRRLRTSEGNRRRVEELWREVRAGVREGILAMDAVTFRERFLRYQAATAEIQRLGVSKGFIHDETVRIYEQERKLVGVEVSDGR
jgi:hypothetical protein